MALLVVSLAECAIGQSIGRNREPRITGQKTLSINEEQSITLQLTDLTVEDRDDWFYPFGFTMKIYEGNNYSFNNLTVTPLLNFHGELVVPVTVNDGEDDSKPFNVKITVNSVNDAPVIAGQSSIATEEDKPVSLQAAQFSITDPDDTQFTLTIRSGTNYTVNGSSVTPAEDFNGKLSVPVTVSDGKTNSAVFNADITVNAINDPPRITGQQTLSAIGGTPYTITLENLTVVDPDNTYPTGFTIIIGAGTNYTVNGSQITPAATFSGELTVPVRVSDGAAQSDPFNVKINVTASNGKPIVTNQVPVITNEDQPVTLTLDMLTVVDSDSNFPQGFTLQVSAGSNYTINGATVSPSPNFFGNLTVPIRVSDGKNLSDQFNLIVNVRPVNDPPGLTLVNSDPIAIKSNASVRVFTGIQISDSDDDSLSLAEIGFKDGLFSATADRLTFTNVPGIRSVFDSQRGVLALIGKAALADYKKAIDSIAYVLSSAAPSGNKTLYLLVSDGQANSNTIERSLTSENAPVEFDIPSAFTPNDDQVNDTWLIRPRSSTRPDATLRIYTRNGLLVHEGKAFENPWDGKYKGQLLPADVYFFTIDLNGEERVNPQLRGVVTILR